MKSNKMKFEFLKTNKGNFVINYESPNVGFNIHGRPDDVSKMYAKLQEIQPTLPEPNSFMSNHHFLVETEVDEDEREDLRIDLLVSERS